MLRFYQTLVVLICLAKSIQVYGNYADDKVVRIEPSTDAHIDYLRSLEDDGTVDFWTEILSPGKGVDARINKKDFNRLTTKFRKMSLPYSIIINNLQTLVDQEQIELAKHVAGRQLNRPAGQARIDILGLYVSYNDIVTYLEQKAAQDSRHSTFDVGRTYQNRTIKGIVLKYNPSAQRNIWIDCGIHAREWITPAACVWIVDSLINDYASGDAEVRSLLDYWNVYVAPSLNPDGYEFSRTAGNRLWRKSRNVNQGSTCIGVDLNRNYPTKWLTGGSSTNPCSDTFAGRAASSEPETVGVNNFLESKRGTWDMYMSFHSYGQWWFTPYGYTTNLPADYNSQKAAADVGANAIKSVNNTAYVVGSVARLLYIASGSTVDWAYEGLGIKHSYTVELPPTNANIGFLLPVEQAPDVCKETYIGMKAFLSHVKKDVSGSSTG